ncbi:MAG TPA: 23S rRNA (guanosine(2251)-2'-O)-methyltransferase RlmB [Thermoanaerobaculia bacterium]|nr:23S rRNA (guanosine(2251)-2'-O)-methyltransferase RlmB [Thermoanaerobaculia bacterium]
MIVYGANPVLEAIRAHPKRVRYVAVQREHSGRMQKLMAEAEEAGVAVKIMTTNEIVRLAGRGVHNGVIAEIGATNYADFHDTLALEETKFVLILDGITDPQNFGAILRVADGFAVDLVVIPEHESVGVTPAAVKASAGASEWVTIAQVTNLARAIEALQQKGFWVYAAAADGDRADKIDFTGKVALVLGSEGKGVRRNVLDHCDRTISIPMFGHVDSFNVASAAAVLCYEVVRQTRGDG